MRTARATKASSPVGRSRKADRPPFASQRGLIHSSSRVNPSTMRILVSFRYGPVLGVRITFSRRTDLSNTGGFMKSLTLLAALCIVAAPLVAQDTTHARHPSRRGAMARHAPSRRGAMARHAPMRGGDDEMMAMMREMMAPMMKVMAYTPDHLLNHKDSLSLTADQVSKLTAIRDSAKAAHDAAGNDFKTHMTELSQAFETASPDTAALRPHFDAGQAAMSQREHM